MFPKEDKLQVHKKELVDFIRFQQTLNGYYKNHCPFDMT